MSISTLRPSSSAVRELASMHTDEFVRVVLQAPEEQLEADELKPSDFESSIAYRMAMIQQNRLRHASGKSRIEHLAEALGLSAHPASTLNAVSIEGSAGSILELLKQIPIRSVILDSPLHQVLPSKVLGHS